MTLVLQKPRAGVHARPAAATREAISPELALVDPELAAAARALLPGPGEFRPAFRTQPAALRRPAALTPPPPSAEPAVRDRPARFHPRRVRRVALVAACTLATVAAVGGAFEATQAGRPEAAAIQAPQQASRTLGAAAVARELNEARTYSWPAVPGARAYEITLLRGRKPVWTATTTAATAVLPARLRLAPGRYTWSATPTFGKPLRDAAARPVVEMTFQVA